MTSSIFFYSRYTSNVISFSSRFSSFNNKAGTEKQHYHYPFLKIISICKRLIKNQDTQWPFLPLNQGIYFKRKHLLLRWATACALTNPRWNVTLLLWHVRYPQLTPTPGTVNMYLKCTSAAARGVLGFLCEHLCTTDTPRDWFSDTQLRCLLLPEIKEGPAFPGTRPDLYFVCLLFISVHYFNKRYFVCLQNNGSQWMTDLLLTLFTSSIWKGIVCS